MNDLWLRALVQGAGCMRLVRILFCRRFSDSLAIVIVAGARVTGPVC